MPTRRDSVRTASGLSVQVQETVIHTVTHRTNTANNRSQFFKDLAVPFYGHRRPNVKVQQGVIDEFWREGMTGAVLGQYECVRYSRRWTIRTICKS